METLSSRSNRSASRILCCLLAGFVGLGFAGLASAEMKLGRRHSPASQGSGNTSFAIPANDECTGALTIPGTAPACSAVVTDVTSATPAVNGSPSATDPVSCIQAVGYIANSIWFTYVPPSTSFYNVLACIGPACAAGETQTTAGDGVLALYTSTGGCSGPFTLVGCDDDSCGQNGPPPQGSPSNIGPISLIGGTTYYILAGNFSNATYNGTIAQYQIRVEETPAPPNDNCATAEPLMLDMPVDGSINSITVNDYQAPTGPTSCYHGYNCETNTGPDTCAQIGNTDSAGAGQDVAYSFTAPNAGGYSFHLKYLNGGVPDSPTPPDPILYISGTCPASSGTIPNCLYAANRVGLPATPPANFGSILDGSEEVLCLHLEAGQTIFPIVDLAVSNDGNNTFVIEAFRCHLEREFNGSPAAADNVDTDGDGTGEGPNSASAACPVEGQITTFPGFPDTDFYTLGTSVLGSRLFAVADCDASNPRSDGAGSVDIDMRVTTATDTLEYDDQDSPVPFGTLCPDVAGTPLPAVPAYIRLNAFSTSISYEPYRLHTTIRAPGPNPPIVNGIGTTATPEPAEPHGTVFSDYVYGSMESHCAGGATAGALCATNADCSGRCSNDATISCLVAADCGPGNTCTNPAPGACSDTDQYAFSANKGDTIMVNLDFDPTRNNTPGRGFFRLVDLTTGHNVPAPYDFLNFSTAVAASSTASSSGTLTGTSPRSPGNAIVWKAQNTGAYIAVVYNVVGATNFGNADYLYQASLNCGASGVCVGGTNPGTPCTDSTTCLGGGVCNTGISSDLAINKTGPATVTAGQDITYAITVTNNGPNPALLAFWTDSVPAGTTFVALDSSGAPDWTCFTPNPGETGDIECDEDTLAFNGSVVFYLTVNVAVCSGNIVVTNTADVESVTADPNPANNSSTAVTTVTDDGSCDDGDACTVGDHCEAGACVPGGPRNCDDSNPCTDDSCDSGTGCVNTNNSAPCDDGNDCTNNDTCSGGSCAGTNAPAGQACASDNNVCTTDGCNGSGTCVHAPNANSCNDNNACTSGDHCSGGACVGSTTISCNDGNVCTNDSCDPIGGCINTCNNNCNAKNEGYWKRICNARGHGNDDHGDDDHGESHSNGEFFTQKDVDCVNNSCTFSDVQTVDQMCAVLDQHGGQCAKAERKFMALLLNVCRCRLNPNQTIDTHCDPRHQTVAQVIAHEDAVLCDPNRTSQTCKHPECGADEVTNGEALWQNTLRITRQGTAVRLTWSAVYGDPNESNGKYRIWRRVLNASSTFTMIGEVNKTTFTFLDTTAGSGTYVYEVTATY